MPTDKIIGAYSNWRIIERTYKTYQRSECIVFDGMGKKVLFGTAPERKYEGLLASTRRKT